MREVRDLSRMPPPGTIPGGGGLVTVVLVCGGLGLRAARRCLDSDRDLQNLHALDGIGRPPWAMWLARQGA